MEESRHVLVTGGAGFLGSYICERLIRQGKQVYCIDNLSSGRFDNLRSVRTHAGFTFINHDIVKSLCSLPFLSAPFYEIYNFACPASPLYYQQDPIQTFQTSVCGVANLLALTHQIKAKMLHISTSEIYGDPLLHPQPESYFGNVNPIGIRACYNEGKRAAETLCFDYNRQYQTRIKVTRLFNVYGPRMQPDDGRVIPNFILQALHNEPLTLYGDGTQTRSFCFVNDVVEGVFAFMNSSDHFIGPVNLGTTDEIRMIDLAEKICELIGSRSQFIFKPHVADDPKRRRPDITLAKSKLNWQPVTSLETGLAETICYFDSVLRAAASGTSQIFASPSG